MNYDPARLNTALERAVKELLAARKPGGAWAGELSGSAFGTATAVCALTLVARSSQPVPAGVQPALEAGLEWLARNVNGDGGWGDTVRSLSNLSATVLAWSAFGMAPGADARYRTVVEGAERWLKQRAGRVEPHLLVPAILNRYWKDPAFAVPILMTCTLAGRLGRDAHAWRRVPALPFELALVPRHWFAAAGAPVLGYVLPGLIAFGQARHQQLPSGNPLARLLRALARRPTLRVLEQIQPPHGGFFEAVPLTSFVMMALVAAAEPKHPVVQRGVRFLLDAMRPDGSWPLETSLNTWLTSLAIAAMEHAPANSRNRLTPDDSAALRWWLLRQQFRVRHATTGALPGGWSWTELPGGVPKADDTAGALLALRQLGNITPEVQQAALAGVEWLLKSQNNDGGMPVFCRGRGKSLLDRSGPGCTASALRAWLMWLDILPPEMQGDVQSAMSRAVDYLIQVQREDGAWVPIWYGNQFSAKEENPVYGTARVLRVLPALAARSYLQLVQPLNDGAQWLVKAQNSDGSWGGIPGAPPSVEETAVAVEALAELLVNPQPLLPAIAEAAQNACMWGTNWLVNQVESGAYKQPAPIGLHFAKFWYYEKLYPLIFTVGALSHAARLVPVKR